MSEKNSSALVGLKDFAAGTVDSAVDVFNVLGCRCFGQVCRISVGHGESKTSGDDWTRGCVQRDIRRTSKDVPE